MVTDRTPAYKRIQRAEQARDEWKVKAVERRLETERVNINSARKDSKIEVQDKEIKHLNEQLTEASKRIFELEKAMEDLKKNSSKRLH